MIHHVLAVASLSNKLICQRFSRVCQSGPFSNSRLSVATGTGNGSISGEDNIETLVGHKERIVAEWKTESQCTPYIPTLRKQLQDAGAKHAYSRGT